MSENTLSCLGKEAGPFAWTCILVLGGANRRLLKDAMASLDNLSTQQVGSQLGLATRDSSKTTITKRNCGRKDDAPPSPVSFTNSALFCTGCLLSQCLLGMLGTCLAFRVVVVYRKN